MRWTCGMMSKEEGDEIGLTRDYTYIYDAGKYPGDMNWLLLAAASLQHCSVENESW